MTTSRPYRETMDSAAARLQLVAGAGSQFDEKVVAALLEVLDSEVEGLDPQRSELSGG
jgi:HD-GYP domain-containing protein (c-di-GMP phosphodiesterase class II)